MLFDGWKTFTKMLLTYQASQKISKEEDKQENRLHFYRKREEIPQVAQRVWQVYRGVVQLSQLHLSGEEVILGWAKPSTFFGMWLNHIETYQAKALSDTYLRWYSLGEIEACSPLARTFFTDTVRGMGQTEALLGIAGLRRVEDRLRELLLLLKQEMGQPVPEGTRIVIRLTHQNIASAMGATRVTVTRLLGEFQRQGYITLDSDRHIVIHHSL